VECIKFTPFPSVSKLFLTSLKNKGISPAFLLTQPIAKEFNSLMFLLFFSVITFPGYYLNFLAHHPAFCSVRLASSWFTAVRFLFFVA
jgi:hypothetical protein